MNCPLRCIIAVPLIASLSVFSGISIAAIPATSPKTPSKSTLSSAGFLDFKSILFSSGSGENLDGVFNQIKFIGPEIFQNAARRHGMLDKFKSSPGPVWSIKPIWQKNDKDLDVLNVEFYGKPSTASSELIDAILGDVTDQYRNHGFSNTQSPGIGSETARHFNAASKKVFDLIDKLEESVSAPVAPYAGTAANQPAINMWHLMPVFIIGMLLVSIGLLWRRFRKKSPQLFKKADPVACFDAIRQSPIQITTKTA